MFIFTRTRTHAYRCLHSLYTENKSQSNVVL